MFRAKCQWVEYGERPTKFVFNMEKQNYNKKTISELRLQDESTTTNEKKIFDHIGNYYKNLFTSEATFSQVECDEFTQHLEMFETRIVIVWKDLCLMKNVKRY